MPCRDPRDNMSCEEQRLSQRVCDENSAHKKTKELLTLRVNSATRAACESITYLLETYGEEVATKALSSESKAWWVEHVRLDQERTSTERKHRMRELERINLAKQKEEDIEQALNKLSKKDRSVLGI
jgi:hypothetical protein